MIRVAICAVLLGGAGALAGAQTSPPQTAPATQNPTPATAQPAQGNPFPEDTTSVPVMPSKSAPGLPAGNDSIDEEATPAPAIPAPSIDQDPARSPDDVAPNADAGQSDSSDSRTNLEKILAPVDDEQGKGKHHKTEDQVPEHQETSAEDIEVGKYELSLEHWKAALSRFESALVLAPDEPEVYWGLAESERHLGNFAAARGYYQKVAEYDPDSRHGKEAIKALKAPEIANAKAIAPGAAPQ